MKWKTVHAMLPNVTRRRLIGATHTASNAAVKRHNVAHMCAAMCRSERQSVQQKHRCKVAKMQVQGYMHLVLAQLMAPTVHLRRRP